IVLPESFCFAFTADGIYVLCADLPTRLPLRLGRERSARLLLHDLASEKVVARSPLLTDEPCALALRPDGRMVACACNRGDVLLWDPGKRTVRRLSRGRGYEGIQGL